jgi:hypothetical protein
LKELKRNIKKMTGKSADEVKHERKMDFMIGAGDPIKHRIKIDNKKPFRGKN